MTQKNKTDIVKKYEIKTPNQLELFINRGGDEFNYSNTVGLYDIMPKYQFGNHKREKSESGKFESLPILERDFVYQKEEYTIAITPAKIKKDGVNIDYYPSQREELVEDVLRKLVCEGYGKFYNDEVGVMFSIYQIWRELQKNNHGYNPTEIKEALQICSGTIIEVKKGGKGISRRGAIFTDLIINEKTNDDTYCFVRFNPLVTRAIIEKNFKKIHFYRCMSFKTMLARWLYKRMSHLYSASKSAPYSILLSTIIRDSGMTTYKNMSDTIKKVQTCLNEMQKQDLIESYTTEPVKDIRNKRKFSDCKFTLIAGKNLLSDSFQQSSQQKKIAILGNKSE